MNRRVKPILYIAFGDPDQVTGAELPGLKHEEANIRAALAGVYAPGPWDVVSGLHCTRAELVKTFDSDRVTVFHFGGHASPQSLLLPAEEKGSQIVNGMLLEDFLARQKNLKLAFFNACSTERWARRLAETIPYVVATVCAVDDAKALDFASAFYAALAADNTIEEAFSRAAGAVALQHEDLKPAAAVVETDAVLGRPEFRRMDTGDDNEQPAFPWVLCRNERATPEDAKWTFSVGAHDPLIGLPTLDPKDFPLPERPYVTIKGHSESDAPLFFGRNAEIRALYDWALKRQDGPPVLLFHGQSGSGKSSLLNAGLLPRLKKERNVVYRRRGVGLVQDLHAAIGGGTDADINAWLDAPAPHLVILDQVEEAITHNAGSANEIRAFVKRVREIFARREPTSRARLVLSFRKEYLAEIQGLFTEDEYDNAAPLLETFWLDRLDSEGIVEVIEGPTRNPDLTRKYGITLEDGFAEFVASRLNDPNSPITTILQIVLNQLWDKATEGGGSPTYTRDLWGKLSALDNPLHGFYGDQLEQVFAKGGEKYRDGLELDLLLEHTSELGSSQRRTLAELGAMYPHLERTQLEDLIRRNKAAYLLVDPPAQEGDGAAATVLVHDTLAPVIRRDFALSVSEGARARRLVENRGREWVGGKQGEPLDAFDLRVVSRGLEHMRALSADERRMLTLSRKRMRRNLGVLAALVAGIAAIGGGLALYERAQEEAQARTKDAIRLASEARAAAANDYDLAVLLSVAAYKTDPSPFEVRDAITSIYQERPEAIAFLQPLIPQTFISGPMAFSADGRLLAVTTNDRTEMWDVQKRTRLWSRASGEGWLYAAFSPDGKWLALADFGAMEVWSAQTGEAVHAALKFPPSPIQGIAFRRSFLLAAGCWVQQWRVNDWAPQAGHPAQEECGSNELTNIAVNPTNDAEIATRSLQGELSVTTASGTRTFASWEKQQGGMRNEGYYFLAYSADGKRLLASTPSGSLEVYDLASGKSIGVQPAQEGVRFTGAGLNPDGTRLTAMRNGALGQWDSASSLAVRPPLPGRWAGLNDAVLSPDALVLAMRGADGTVLLLDNTFGIGSLPPVITGSAAVVKNSSAIAFSSDGKWIATGTEDGDVLLWDAAKRTLVRRFEPNPDQGQMVQSLAFSPDSKVLAWPGPGAPHPAFIGVQAASIPDGTRLAPLMDKPDYDETGINAVTFAPDGRVVAISSSGVLRMWDVAHGGTMGSLRGKAAGGISLEVSVSPDGKYLAVPGTGGRVLNVLRMDNGDPVQPPIGQNGVWAYTLDMNPMKNAPLVAEGHPYGISVWNYLTGKKLGGADLGETVVRSVKFSPDGKLLAVGLDSGALRLWDVAAGRWIGNDIDLQHSGEILDIGPKIAFSPDGKKMVWIGPNGSFREWDWDLHLDNWAERGCALAARNMTLEEWNENNPGKKYVKLCPGQPDAVGTSARPRRSDPNGK